MERGKEGDTQMTETQTPSPPDEPPQPDPCIKKLLEEDDHLQHQIEEEEVMVKEEETEVGHLQLRENNGEFREEVKSEDNVDVYGDELTLAQIKDSKSPPPPSLSPQQERVQIEVEEKTEEVLEKESGNLDGDEQKQKEKEQEDGEEDEESKGPPPGWDSLPPPPPPIPTQQERGQLQVPGKADEVMEKDKGENVLGERQQQKHDDKELEGPPPGWDPLPPPPPSPLPPEQERSQMVCGSCRHLLSYPQGSKHVRCSCCQTVNYVLEEHEVGQVKCGNCAILLMYPYGAQSVRCCSCGSVISIGDHNRRPPLSVQQSKACRPFDIPT